MATLHIRLPDGSLQELSHPDNWSDVQVKEAIYKHFPVDANSKKMDAPERKGWASVLDDVEQDVGEVPGALGNFFTQLPKQAALSGSQIKNNPLRAAGNVGAGLLEGAKGAVNIPSNIASYLGSKGIGNGQLQDIIKALHIGDTGLQNAVLGAPQEGDELLQSIGSFAPYARAGGLARGLGGATKRAGAAGAYATGQNEDPVVAALMGLTGEGLIRGGQKVKGSTLLPSSPLTADELKQALKVTQGTETGLGDVIQNPFLKRQLENVLPEVPFSGANNSMQKTAQAVTSKGEDILNNMSGSQDTSNVGQSLHEALKKSESETRKIKNEKFNALNEESSKIGVTTNRSNLRSEAKEALEKIKSDPDLALLTDKRIKSLLQGISEAGGGKDYSLKETDLLRGKLGEKAHDAYLSNETELGQIYKSLKDAAHKDINSAIDNSKNPTLHSLRNEAMNFYKKEYAPFEEPEIMKFTRKGGDPDLLAQAFIKNSRLSDRSNLLEKLSSKLKPEERNLLAYSYFSNALKDGKLNPMKFSTLYKNLGERQRKALLGDEGVSALNDYTSLVGKNTEPLNLMFNPKTGQKNLSALAAIVTGAGALGGLATGGISHAVIGGLAPGLIARPAVKALTSQKVRESVVKSMIKSREKSKKAPKNLAPLLQALTQVVPRETEKKRDKRD